MANEIQDIRNYNILLRHVKQRVALAQQRVIYAANEELLRMYWDLGQMLHAAQQAEGWGKGTLVRLSQDLKNEYPKEKGFSERNLRCMMEFYQEYNQELTMVKSNAKPSVSHLTAGKTILQPAVAELQEHAIAQPAVAKLSEYNFTLPIRLCREGDNKTIGFLLCKSKDKIKSEYALRDIQKPIGISDYELGQALPKDLRSSLPSIEDIEAELEPKHQPRYDD